MMTRYPSHEGWPEQVAMSLKHFMSLITIIRHGTSQAAGWITAPECPQYLPIYISLMAEYSLSQYSILDMPTMVCQSSVS